MWPFSKRPTLNDPVFGMLRFFRNHKYPQFSRWQGDLVLPFIEGQFDLEVYADEHGPTNQQRHDFDEFRNHGQLIRAELQREMWEDYSFTRKEFGPPAPREKGKWGVPDIGRAEDVWKHATLFTVEVKMGDNWLRFGVEWDCEHGRSAQISDYKACDYYDE